MGYDCGFENNNDSNNGGDNNNEDNSGGENVNDEEENIEATLVGDVDCSGEINSQDASLILQYVSKFYLSSHVKKTCKVYQLTNLKI